MSSNICITHNTKELSPSDPLYNKCITCGKELEDILTISNVSFVHYWKVIKHTGFCQECTSKKTEKLNLPKIK